MWCGAMSYGDGLLMDDFTPDKITCQNR
jgi:hypothetical protein